MTLAAHRSCGRGSRGAGRLADPERLSVDATVLAKDADGGVELGFAGSASCSGCAGTCMWLTFASRDRARLPCALPLREGDPVRVSLPANQVLLGSLLLHGMPLASLLLGGAAGAFLTQSDLGCFVGAVAGVMLMLGATRRLRRRIERSTVACVELERLR